MRSVKYVVVIAAVLSAAFALNAAAQPAPAITAEVLTATGTAQPGTKTEVAFRFALTKGWHVNAHEPKDEFATPTTLTLSPPEGITVTAMGYPEAHEFKAEFQEDALSVYEDGFVIGVRLKLADGLAPGEYTVPGTLSYQACNSATCAFPTEKEVTLTLKVAAEAPSAAQNTGVFKAITWEEEPAAAVAMPMEEVAPVAPGLGQSKGGLFADSKKSFEEEEMAAEPESASADLSAESFTAHDVVPAGGTAQVAFRFGVASGWHVNAHEPYEDFLTPTVLTLTPPDEIDVKGIAYPKAIDFKAEFQDALLAVYEDGFLIGAELIVGDSMAPGEYTVPGVLHYQACNHTSCAFPSELPVTVTVTVAEVGAAQSAQHADVFGAIDWDSAVAPEAGADEPAESPAEEEPMESTGDWQAQLDHFKLVGRAFGYMGADEFMGFLDEAEAAGSVAAAPEGSEAAYEEQGVAGGGAGFLEGQSIAWVILLILGGGFLLNLTPCVLPLIPINIAIIGAGARASSRARGFALGGAYGLGIALVYGALGLVVVLGLSSAFGSINSSPWFNLGIAVLFIVLGLAMFDVIQIDFSKYQAKVGVRKNEKGSFFLAFFMGAIAALLAGACVAPVVIYTIIYAQDLYNTGNTVALVLPFLLGVGMALPWPFAGAGLSFLPKPGMWMVRVKQTFGVFIIAFAAYYGYHAYEGFQTVDPAEVAESAEEAGWEHDLGAGLARAAEEGKPVFIDFWATWCKNCLVMNSTTFKDEAVLNRLGDYVLIKYQAEKLSDPAVKPVLEHFNVLGLPTYVVLQPKE